jgi:hypothetical protein
VAEQLDLARVRIGEAQAEAQRGGLARAVGAEQSEAFARRDLEVDAAHDLLASVALAQALHLQ